MLIHKLEGHKLTHIGLMACDEKKHPSGLLIIAYDSDNNWQGLAYVTTDEAAEDGLAEYTLKYELTDDGLLVDEDFNTIDH